MRSPCPPRFNGADTFLCARAVSQRSAMQRARGERPKRDGTEGLMLCVDCMDDLTLLGGNTRAVQEEWKAD